MGTIQAGGVAQWCTLYRALRNNSVELGKNMKELCRSTTNSIIHTRTEQSHPPDFQEKHKKKLRDAFGKKCHQSVVQFRKMGNLSGTK